MKFQLDSDPFLYVSDGTGLEIPMARQDLSSQDFIWSKEGYIDIIFIISVRDLRLFISGRYIPYLIYYIFLNSWPNFSRYEIIF